MSEARKTVRVTVVRTNPAEGEEPSEVSYDVPCIFGMSISNALQYINAHFDGGISHYLSCRRGLCVGCAIKANGKNLLACVTPVPEEGDLRLEAAKARTVATDLLDGRKVPGQI